MNSRSTNVGTFNWLSRGTGQRAVLFELLDLSRHQIFIDLLARRLPDALDLLFPAR